MKLAGSPTHYHVSAFVRKDHLPVVLLRSHTKVLGPRLKAGLLPAQHPSCQGFPKGSYKNPEVSVNNEIIDVEYSQPNPLCGLRYVRESQIAIYRNCTQISRTTEDGSAHQIDLYV